MTYPNALSHLIGGFSRWFPEIEVEEQPYRWTDNTKIQHSNTVLCNKGDTQLRKNSASQNKVNSSLRIVYLNPL